MKKVLLYYPPNKRSVAIETLCLVIKEAGHEVIVLTLTEKGDFHTALEEKGIATFSYVLARNSSWKYFYSHARYLRRFCRQQRVDIVLSHLQEGNIIAVLAQPWLKARLIAFRHHAESAFYTEYGSKFGLKRNWKEVLLDRIINRFARCIVVPSSDVWKSMVQYEGCKPGKIRLVPYIYDFSAYPQPDEEAVKKLRTQYPCQLMLIMVSRMVISKQHQTVFTVVKKLIGEGLSVKMLVMDDGPLRQELETFVENNKLAETIIFTGFRKDFINYMAAADLLIHPSLTEASNNVVKEMGLLEKAVAVCKDVGDFNEYIREGENGYFLNRSELDADIEQTIRTVYAHPEKGRTCGQALKNDVLRYFSNTAENKQRLLDLLN